jgi:hypothetical protein
LTNFVGYALGILDTAEGLRQELSTCGGIVETAYTLIMNTQGHEGLVKEGISCAVELLAAGAPKDPALVSTGMPKTNKNARLASRREFVVLYTLFAKKNCSLASEGFKPGKVGLSAGLKEPGGLSIKSVMGKSIVDVHPVLGCKSPGLGRCVGGEKLRPDSLSN